MGKSLGISRAPLSPRVLHFNADESLGIYGRLLLRMPP